MSAILLSAPFAGWVAPLAEVPDPVFAELMMGDGVAIDPLEGLLRAPCDARVASVAPTAHAVTLELGNGAQLLIHLGLETVALNGEGFALHVGVGETVRTGDPLISFDLETIAALAKSLVTPIVVANAGFAVRRVAIDGPVTAGQPLMEVSGTVGREAVVTDDGPGAIEREITMPMAHGLHARPAARIVDALKRYDAKVRFCADGRSADARSVVAMLGLGLVKGDRLIIRATGADAARAIDSIASLILGGMGELHATSAPSPVPAAPAASSGPVFKGVAASPGLAAGPLYHFKSKQRVIHEQGSGAAEERVRLQSALAAAVAALEMDLSGPAGEIAKAHRSLIEDPELQAAAMRGIAAEQSAAFAWRSAILKHSDRIRSTGNAFLIERIADLRDVEERVLAQLQHDPSIVQELPDGAILTADELLPSQFLALDQARLAGIVTARGGPTSHVAILAGSAGIPMLVAAGEAVLRVNDGEYAILDVDRGFVDTSPSPAARAQAALQLRSRSAANDAAAANAAADCYMADGTRIEVFANLSSVRDAARAVAMGAEGCGLLRTEFLFLDRAEAPTQAEQSEIYAGIAASLEARPLIIRTLDIGADKPVPFLRQDAEENPALGCRGVRLSLRHAALLATQFRAILAAVPSHQCRIMVPMIVDIDEFREVRRIFEAAAQAVGVSATVPLGVMIETPAAALIAASLAAEADFFSVGTNDLTQYTLAADRGNSAVAHKIDALHPAVLKLIDCAAEGAARHNRLVACCGSVASDPGAAALLIGLGIRELSVAPDRIPLVKSQIRGLRLDACREIARRALAASSAADVRALLKVEA